MERTKLLLLIWCASNVGTIALINLVCHSSHAQIITRVAGSVGARASLLGCQNRRRNSHDKALYPLIACLTRSCAASWLPSWTVFTQCVTQAASLWTIFMWQFSSDRPWDNADVHRPVLHCAFRFSYRTIHLVSHCVCLTLCVSLCVSHHVTHFESRRVSCSSHVATGLSGQFGRRADDKSAPTVISKTVSKTSKTERNDEKDVKLARMYQDLALLPSALINNY